MTGFNYNFQSNIKVFDSLVSAIDVFFGRGGSFFLNFWLRHRIVSVPTPNLCCQSWLDPARSRCDKEVSDISKNVLQFYTLGLGVFFRGISGLS